MSKLLINSQNNISENGNLRVFESNSEVDMEWISYIASSKESAIYHHPFYLRALEAETEFPVTRLVCRDNNGTIVGILPVQKTRGMLMGLGGVFASARISSLPRTPHAGVISDGKVVTELLVSNLINKSCRGSEYKIQIKSNLATLYDGISELLKFLWYEYYYLELPDNLEKLKFGNARNHRRIKWAINKARKSGVRVRSAESKKDLKEWYKLYLLTRRWHGVPARSYIFFETLWDLMKDKGLLKLLLAEYGVDDNKIMIAGSLFFNFNQVVYYAFNGRDQRFLNLRPNDFIQWEAIHQAIKDGVTIYDMGGVEIGQKGLADFKSKWGCKSGEIFHFYDVNQVKEKDINIQDGYSSALRRNIWRKLPLSLTEKLSERINKRL
jgi:hypothetical protein